MVQPLNGLNELQCLVIWAQTLGLKVGHSGVNELQVLKAIAGFYSSNQPLNGLNEVQCLKIIGSALAAGHPSLNGLNEFQLLVIIARALGFTPNFPGGNELDVLRLIAGSFTGSVTPASLQFFVQPGGAVAGVPFTQQPVVRVLDSMGAVITGFTGEIGVELAVNTGGSTLSGALTVSAVAGIATFTNLSLNLPGTATLLAYVVLNPVFGPHVESASFSVTSTDPLAGFDWAARLQTHAGDNVPLGLWQDVGMTVPATADFDPIAAWSDELSASGIVAVQADEAKQPFLLFVDGVPTIVFDGVDDFLSIASLAVAQPATEFVSVQIISPANIVYLLDGTTSDHRMAVGTGLSGGSNFLSYFAGGSIPEAAYTRGGFDVLSVKFNGASSAMWKNGSAFVSGDAGSQGVEGLTIGARFSGTVCLEGSYVAALISPTSLSDPNRAIVDPYLSDLNP